MKLGGDRDDDVTRIRGGNTTERRCLRCGGSRIELGGCARVGWRSGSIQMHVEFAGHLAVCNLGRF